MTSTIVTQYNITLYTTPCLTVKHAPSPALHSGFVIKIHERKFLNFLMCQKILNLNVQINKMTKRF